MGLIPWRYLSPRRSYFRELKVARACPEIKNLIDKAAFYKLCERFTMIPLAIIFVAVLPLVTIVEFAKKMLQSLPAILPDFSNKRRRVIDEIHSIVPLQEMRLRAGLKEPVQVRIKRNGKVVDGGALEDVE